MVRRYEGIAGLLRENPAGIVVLYSDYHALQAALREALQNWYEWNELHQSDADDRNVERRRITELRKQFLED